MIWAFVDCENVGPLKNIDFSPYERVILFLGPNNHTLSLPAGTGYLIQPIQVAKGGKNNLDFHLALHMGMHHGTVPMSVAFHLISNDKGMDVLVEHLMSLGRPCRKVPVVIPATGQQPSPPAQKQGQNHHSPAEKLITTHVSPIPLPPPRPPAELRQDTRLVLKIREAIKASADESGWATLGLFGKNIRSLDGNFSCRAYGYAKLSALLEAIGLFRLDRTGPLPRVKDERPTAAPEEFYSNALSPTVPLTVQTTGLQPQEAVAASRMPC